MAQTTTRPAATTTDSNNDVELRDVFKFFGSDAAVRGVELSIRQGEFFSILGPSGCGKTTTLRMIAGFDAPSAGEVYIQGQAMNRVPVHRRPVNTVFQSYALFNHLTVRENIGFGLRLKKRSRAEITERVDDALKLVKLEPLADRFPGQLSGGQQQRVALARALINRPAVLLLDEPLGALDLKLRKEMQVELSNLHQDLGLTFVMVTHDQEEALSLSDRIAVMNHGVIEQVDTPNCIYEQPQTAFVAGFIGDTNLFSAKVEGFHPDSLWVITDKGLKLTVQPPISGDLPTSGPVMVSVRPERIRVGLDHPEGDRVNGFEGTLENVMYMGTHMHYLVALRSGDRLIVRQPGTPDEMPTPGAPIYVYWTAADCIALPHPGTDARA